MEGLNILFYMISMNVDILNNSILYNIENRITNYKKYLFSTDHRRGTKKV